MAVLVNNVSNQARLGVPLLQKVRGLGRELSNHFVLRSLLLEQLGRIALGLLDGTNFLLEQVELTTSGFLLELDCASVGALAFVHWTKPRPCE